MNKIKKKMSLCKLDEKQMKVAKGGAECNCGCAYVNCGGSSSWTNGWVNGAGGLSTPEGAGC